MTKTLPAIWESGVLRPLEALDLAEHERVAVTVSTDSEPASGWLDHEYMAAIDALDESEPEPTLAQVRAALAKIPGKLSDDIRQDRESRG
ncbi:MAG: antitoxin family protein [Bryobacterales bacterium]|nr:antitoxin family protein [Bryobacterales bacterium]